LIAYNCFVEQNKQSSWVYLINIYKSEIVLMFSED